MRATGKIEGQETEDKWQVLRYLRFMKHTVTVVLIAFVFLSSTCKKAMQVPDPELKKILGKWEWVSTSGGFAGKNSTPSNAGYDLRIEFKSNSMFVRYKDSTLIDNKKFSF